MSLAQHSTWPKRCSSLASLGAKKSAESASSQRDKYASALVRFAFSLTSLTKRRSTSPSLKSTRFANMGVLLRSQFESDKKQQELRPLLTPSPLATQRTSEPAFLRNPLKTDQDSRRKKHPSDWASMKENGGLKSPPSIVASFALKVAALNPTFINGL